MLVLYIASRTHYGRGTPPTQAEVRRNIEAVQLVFDEIVPGRKVYGYVDEDYGWVVPLSQEEKQEILRRYPESFEEYGIAYLHNGAEYADEFVASNGQTLRANVLDLPDVATAKAVECTYEALHQDWFDNYGRW